MLSLHIHIFMQSDLRLFFMLVKQYIYEQASAKSCMFTRTPCKQKQVLWPRKPRLLKLFFSKESVSGMFWLLSALIWLDRPAGQPVISFMWCKSCKTWTSFRFKAQRYSHFIQQKQLLERNLSQWNSHAQLHVLMSMWSVKLEPQTLTHPFFYGYLFHHVHQ